MNDFLSWCMHLLVPFLFHDLTSLHPPSFIEMIFILVLCSDGKYLILKVQIS